MEQDGGFRLLADNRRARHNYFFLEKFEAGMALTGSEVKSARGGKLQLSDAYAAVRGGEIWLYNAHISPYEQANQQNHDPVRPRKLLLHRHEIKRLIGKTQEKGLTLVPAKVYLRRGLIKCELALAQGKKVYDKREKIRRKVAEKEAKEAIRMR